MEYGFFLIFTKKGSFFRNSLTSQEVIDFVNDRIDTMSLKEIGSEVFLSY